MNIKVKLFLITCLWFPLFMIAFLLDTFLTMITLTVYMWIVKEKDMLFPRLMSLYNDTTLKLYQKLRDKAFKLGPIQTKWLESLEQHPERQNKNTLGKRYPDGSYTACCLGELGLIAGVCRWGGLSDNVLIVTDLSAIDEYSANYLDGTSYEEVGLYSARGRTRDGDNQDVNTLASLNDNSKTWPEIAAIVRANPAMYFKKSV